MARAFVVAPGSGAHAEWGYVALSRARDGVCLFLGEDPDGDPLAELAISLRTRAARPPALVQAQAPPERVIRVVPEDGPAGDRTVARESAQHHKRVLTRTPTLGR